MKGIRLEVTPTYQPMNVGTELTLDSYWTGWTMQQLAGVAVIEYSYDQYSWINLVAKYVGAWTQPDGSIKVQSKYVIPSTWANQTVYLRANHLTDAVKSNVIAVTVTGATSAISLQLSVNRTTYDPSIDFLQFTVVASGGNVDMKTVELYVDGNATGKRNWFQPAQTRLTISLAPPEYPDILKQRGSHSCKVISVGW